MIDRTLRLATAAALFVVCIGLGQTQADQLLVNMPALMQACGTDVRTFCAGISPGGGRIARCLEANAAQVSPACRAAVSASLHDICGPDIQRFCANVSAGRRTETCLKAHINELSGSCKAAADQYAIK
jgi:hypothetical protein